MDARLFLSKRDILSSTWFYLPWSKVLSRPSYWFIKRHQKILLRPLPMRDDAAIFLVQDHAVVLSIRMIDLG